MDCGEWGVRGEVGDSGIDLLEEVWCVSWKDCGDDDTL